MKLIIDKLNKSYNGSTILSDISIDINNVSSVGIIGESGCGKSTLLRQLAGIENPDSGQILINGVSPITDKSQFQSRIGYVFQKHNLFPHLSVKKNITLILTKSKKMDRHSAEEKADEVLKRMFIEKEADKLPHQISGGQAQRASIARALATDPELIFLDEPTAALDPVLTNEVLKSVESLKNDGKDFIFVTHEISFLKNFADYVIFLKNGSVSEQGYADCLDAPKTKELKEFLKIY